MSIALDDILARLGQKSPKAVQAIGAASKAALDKQGIRWVPNPGPQTEAYFSKADELLFGGEPGGGKTAICIGLAFNCHKRSLFMRRQYTDLDGCIDYALKVNGSRDGFNGSAPPRLVIGDEHFIDFGAAGRVGSEQSWMGRPHDLICFDEATQFAKNQIRFLLGWLRHENKAQRTRVVLATNPPLGPEGLWVIEMFAPWLDPHFPKPAKPGELRWYVVDENGDDRWVDGPIPIQIGGKLVAPKSRTYIHSSVKDNPYYAGGDYERQLANMTEPFRSILMGGFKTSFKDQPNQIIPTRWIQLAQERWKPFPPEHAPMCALGVDCSGGGEDPMAIAHRYDSWFGPIREIPGREIPAERAGAFAAGRVSEIRRDGALVVVDMGGGYGGPLYECLASNHIEAYSYKGGGGTHKRTADRKLGFTNVRTAALWAFREALDPGQPGGSDIALPPDSTMLADLAAPTFEVKKTLIQAEPKEDVCARLGRSTNRGDAVIMCWWEGAKMINSALEWADQRQGRVVKPKVVMSSNHPHRRQ